MPTAEELRIAAENTSLIRKALVVIGYLAPMSAAPVTKLYESATGFIQVPEDYVPVGLVSRGNPYSFPTDATTEDVTSLNHGGPTRQDIVSATRTINYTAQETKRSNLEVAYGLELGSIVQDEDGEAGFAHPEVPLAVERRLLIVGWDPKAGGWAMGRFYPKVQPNAYPEITWGGDSAIEYETTLQSFVDDTLGYSLWDIPVAGPGALAAREALGFAAPTP
ncbi:hypothetical protein [Georgenia wangjunii]|uniref:hypothetical protein n=1 Tax=Georgenia wangjunii TaxID=3117730 RepID=UPI002F2644DD